MEWKENSVSVCGASAKERVVDLKKVIQNSKVIIFDLDGTLYEGKSHFEYYANLIKLELQVEKQSLFGETYRSMLDGNHPIKFGTVYDAVRDYVITLSPSTLEVQSVCNWEGEIIKDGESLYESPFNLNDPTRVVVGDGWFLPVAAAVHFGLTEMYHCYYKTKEYMSSDEFVMEQTKGLKESLTKLKDIKNLVLMTNSEYDDAMNILKMLELSNVFDLVIADAFKPENTIKHLEGIVEKYHVKCDEVISIGDNFINEVIPAVQLGMNGICITNHELDVSSDKLFTVNTLENLFE